VAKIKSDAFSSIMIVGAFVLPVVTNGMIDASATRKPVVADGSALVPDGSFHPFR